MYFTTCIVIIYSTTNFSFIPLFYNSKTNSLLVTKSEAKASSKNEKKKSIIISRAHVSSFVIQLKSFGRVGPARSGTRR